MARSVEEITREQLDALKEKFELVQGDRRAFFDTYETTKKSNEELLVDLKRKNKELRDALGTAQKNAREQQLRRATGRDPAQVEAQLLAIRTQNDTLRHRSQHLAKEYKVLRDELALLSREEAAQTSDNPGARTVRQLENRLDKAMIKYNEAQSIRKTYEQIVRRLREERVGFDTQLAAIEKTLRAKATDLDELQLLAQEASHAKDVALAELEKTKSMALEDKEKRLKDLREKRGLVVARSKMNEAARERERLRRERVMAVHGDMDAMAERALQASVVDQEREHRTIVEQTAEARRRVERYEAAFQKIREATGVKDENEVIQKIISQKEQHQSLQQLTRDNARRIEELNREMAELKSRVDQLKFSGGDGRGGGRQLIDSLDAQLKAALKELGTSKDKHERVSRALIELRSGIEHMSEKLQGLRKEQQLMGMTGAEPGAASSSSSSASAAAAAAAASAASAGATPAVSDDAAGWVLNTQLSECEGVLLRALRFLRQFEKAYRRQAIERSIREGSGSSSLTAADDDDTIAVELPQAIRQALETPRPSTSSGLPSSAATGAAGGGGAAGGAGGSGSFASASAGVALGSDLATQLGLTDDEVVRLRANNMRVDIRRAEGGVSAASLAGKPGITSPPSRVSLAAGSASDDEGMGSPSGPGAAASSRRDLGASSGGAGDDDHGDTAGGRYDDDAHDDGGDEDDDEDVPIDDEDEITHDRVKRDAANTVEAHAVKLKRKARKGRANTEPPRYLSQ